MDEPGGEELIHTAHALLRDFGQAPVATIAAVNAIAFGGGCELAMACDVRIAAEAAVFGQPEVKLGIIPGFGGTQRLPRLVGENKALEMNLIGDAILSDEALEYGLVNRVVPDHELFETALMWGRKLAAQAPVALEQIKRVSPAGDLDDGIEAEKQGFATAFRSEDAKEGIAAFLGKRTPRWKVDSDEKESDRLDPMSARARIAAAGVVALVMLAPAPALGAADLAVTQTAEPDSLPLGTAAAAEVVVTVANKGTEPATNVTATIGGWEPELAFVSATPSQGTFNSVNGLWFIGTVTSVTAQTLALRFDDAQTGVARLKTQAATETPESGSANNSASATIRVVGLVPSPELLAFPSLSVGGIGPSKSLTLTNGAAIPLRVGSIQIAGADFVNSGDGCSGVELTPDTACQLNLGFAPTAAGDRAGTLTVLSSTAKVPPSLWP